MQHVSQVSETYHQSSSHASLGARGNFDQSLMSLRSSWPNLVADLSIEAGTVSLAAETIETAPSIRPNDNWVEITAQTSFGNLWIYVPARICAILLESAQHAPDIARLEGIDAALIIEHLCTHKLSDLEARLATKIELVKIADVTTHVSKELFGFKTIGNGETYLCAVGFENKLKDVVESVCAEYALPIEKNLDPKMIVHLGPVIVPARQAYLARTNEAIDCGVTPSDIIHGVLLRSDGRYWPIHIEDTEIELVGELSGPISAPEANSENVFITFGLGDISMNAYERSNMRSGQRFEINRLPDNSADVYYQARPFGQGHLSILGSNLAVTLDRIGSFEV